MRVAAVQMTSGPHRDVNLTAAGAGLDAAAARGAELVVLPEMFNVLGDGAVLRAGAEPLDGPTLDWARSRAVRHGVWLVAGSIIERRTDDSRANTSCLLGPDGALVAAYRKIHLFDVDVEGATFAESRTVSAGSEAVVADAGPVRIGMSICYDLRFPELFRMLGLAGATVVTLPSAFTAVTGRDHWEVLVRARAIEEQVYVVAAGQCGATAGVGAWHGHSMVVDPWGRVLADAGGMPGVVVADVDLRALADVRRRVPSLAHRRVDVYGGGGGT